ncbi:MAG: hypothetical protein EXR28_05435 [Betaproteobacteria bacterium]|nr:hypothetical protein [Betaproteobacteria bacterium]
MKLLHVLLLKLRRLSVIVNSHRPHQAMLDQIRASAKAIGVTVSPVTVTSARGLERAFKAVVSNKSEAFVVVSDRVFSILMPQISKFAGEHLLSTMCAYSVLVEQGCLMGYGVAPQPAKARSCARPWSRNARRWGCSIASSRASHWRMERTW